MFLEQDKRQRDQEVKKAMQAKNGRCKAETAEVDPWAGRAENEISDLDQVNSCMHSFVPLFFFFSFFVRSCVHSCTRSSVY